MTVATFHKRKLYIPRDIQERLGLVDGDRLEISIVNGREARIRVVRGDDATRRLLGLLDDPPMKGKVLGRLRRREIYEDVA